MHLSISLCFVLPLFLFYCIMPFSLTCAICRYKGPSTDPGIITRTVEDIYKVCFGMPFMPANMRTFLVYICCMRITYEYCLSFLATQRLSLPGQQRTLHLQYVQLYNGVLSDLLDPGTRYMRCAFLVYVNMMRNICTSFCDQQRSEVGDWWRRDDRGADALAKKRA